MIREWTVGGVWWVCVVGWRVQMNKGDLPPCQDLCTSKLGVRYPTYLVFIEDTYLFHLFSTACQLVFIVLHANWRVGGESTHKYSSFSYTQSNPGVASNQAFYTRQLQKYPDTPATLNHGLALRGSRSQASPCLNSLAYIPDS